MPFSAFAWPSFESDNLSWATILALLIVQSAFFVLLPSYLRNIESRNHHKEKLVNELLASHQFIYFGYYVGLLRTIKVNSSEEWVVTALAILQILTFIFAVICFVKARNQDKLIKKSHPCKKNCQYKFNSSLKWRLYGWTIIMAIISFGFALFLAFHPSLVKQPALSNPPQNSATP